MKLSFCTRNIPLDRESEYFGNPVLFNWYEKIFIFFNL